MIVYSNFFFPTEAVQSEPNQFTIETDEAISSADAVTANAADEDDNDDDELYDVQTEEDSNAVTTTETESSTESFVPVHEEKRPVQIEQHESESQQADEIAIASTTVIATPPSPSPSAVADEQSFSHDETTQYDNQITTENPSVNANIKEQDRISEVTTQAPNDDEIIAATTIAGADDAQSTDGSAASTTNAPIVETTASSDFIQFDSNTQAAVPSETEAPSTIATEQSTPIPTAAEQSHQNDSNILILKIQPSDLLASNANANAMPIPLALTHAADTLKAPAFVSSTAFIGNKSSSSKHQGNEIDKIPLICVSRHPLL